MASPAAQHLVSQRPRKDSSDQQRRAWGQLATQLAEKCVTCWKSKLELIQKIMKPSFEFQPPAVDMQAHAGTRPKNIRKDGQATAALPRNLKHFG